MTYDDRFRLDETDQYLRIYFGTIAIFDARKGSLTREEAKELDKRVNSALSHWGSLATINDLRGIKCDK